MPRGRRGKFVENRIARRYKRAGFDVEIRKFTGAGEIDILAKKGGERYAIEVKHGKKRRVITSSEVEKISKKAKRARAKPVLILSGKCRLSERARKTARKKGVRVKNADRARFRRAS